jgi:hypothetical protein
MEGGEQMRFTINVPVEQPYHVLRKVVSFPFSIMRKAEEHVAEETTKQVVKVVLGSERGQAMLAEALLQGLKNANLKETAV